MHLLIDCDQVLRLLSGRIILRNCGYTEMVISGGFWVNSASLRKTARNVTIFHSIYYKQQIYSKLERDPLVLSIHGLPKLDLPRLLNLSRRFTQNSAGIYLETVSLELYHHG